MKHFWLTAALVMGTWAMSIAQENSSNNYYSIHLGSFVNLDPSDFEDLRSLGYLYTESFSEHLSHLFMGEYKTEPSAQSIIKLVHKKGFPDAYVSKRNLSADQKVEVIQLGIELADEQIAWKKYSNALPISTIIDENKLRIVTGPYPSHDATVRQVEKYKKAGYGNAFLRTEYSLRLHPVTDFEASELFTPESQLPIAATTSKATPPIELPKFKEPDVEAKLATVEKTVPEVKSPPVQKIPEDYEPEFIAKSIGTKGLSSPAIRAELKRTSALELQKVLKQEKIYSGSLDGYYGPETGRAYEQFKESNINWKKYLLVVKYLKPDVPEVKNETLVKGISMIISEPTKAKNILKTSDHPIAKAYLAYMLHEASGDLMEINKLMNAANLDCHKGYEGTPAFDYEASYSYQNFSQLIGHLAQLHGVKKEVPVPCWIFQKHNNIAIEAFSKVSDYTMEGCDPFMDWEPVQNLQSIAADLNLHPQESVSKEINGASKRSKLFLSPKNLSGEELINIFSWNDLFWGKMEKWAKEDPLHQKITTTLRVAYFQSQVLMEDYYLNKGLAYKQAKATSLLNLRTIVSKEDIK